MTLRMFDLYALNPSADIGSFPQGGKGIFIVPPQTRTKSRLALASMFSTRGSFMLAETPPDDDETASSRI